MNEFINEIYDENEILKKSLSQAQERIKTLEEGVNELENLVYPYRNKTENYKAMWEEIKALQSPPSQE